MISEDTLKALCEKVQLAVEEGAGLIGTTDRAFVEEDHKDGHGPHIGKVKTYYSGLLKPEGEEIQEFFKTAEEAAEKTIERLRGIAKDQALFWRAKPRFRFMGYCDTREGLGFYEYCIRLRIAVIPDIDVDKIKPQGFV